MELVAAGHKVSTLVGKVFTLSTRNSSGLFGID
ncbi:Hypothetical protein CpCP13_2095 [Corynebacterium pseudotuberculosis]|nr:Hypothetical protein CpPAT10_2055c [Corynebacterium pseudotuberculosis PAT10]AEP71270.1 Hypothetical protein Cp4202_2043 [Corynebacterium pseudotuberculosis 42/02-A]AER70038.1 Hypothetical protein Cp106_2008 [Corynebacterium pseudotuberculosis 1/06-A]AFF23194.1 Hypothetical protein CpP54B96_2085 [Corynebacterium pseudotuberculosis P54B96]AFH52998.1 Hypothetical protein Cp267_2128 [Corynebacterium pseudotuberculosis 267]AJC14782.1 hypothetical protein CpVD57_2091 [Corynebacterium pseudotuber